MKKRFLIQAATLALSTALVGCGDTGTVALNDTVSASIALSQTPSTVAASSASTTFLVEGGPDDTVTFGGRHIRRSAIDSLIVTVTRVDVLPDSEIHRCHPPVGDSLEGFHPGPTPPGLEGDGRGPGGPMGPGGGPCGPGRGRDGHEDLPHPPHADSLEPPDSGWGARQRDWFSLDVVGSGHLDLLALPTDTANGLTLASGSLPVGEYGGARLIVSSAKIYFDTTFTTGNGFTFNANTAYDVKIPLGRDSLMGIMSNAGFTLSAAGANVTLTFSPFATIRGASVDASGNIVIRPVLRPHRGGPPHP